MCYFTLLLLIIIIIIIHVLVTLNDDNNKNNNKVRNTTICIPSHASRVGVAGSRFWSPY